jgi:hypothetical protein
MAFEILEDTDELTSAPGPTDKTPSVGFQIPTDPVTPEPESFGRTLLEGVKETFVREPGKAIARITGLDRPEAEGIVKPEKVEPAPPAAPKKEARAARHLTLQPDEEADFQAWNAKWAAITGTNPDPDHPEHRYDYRAAWKAGVEPQMDPSDGRYHWDSRFKDPDHPNRYFGGVDTITGKPVSEAKEPEIRERPGPGLEEPGIFARVLSGLGLVDLEKAAERRRVGEAAKAAIQMTAAERGETTREFKERGGAPSEIPGQALTGAAEAITLGIGGAAKRAAGLDDETPETTAGGLARAGGHLAGFVLTSPIAVGQAAEALVFGRYLAPLATDTTRMVLAKAVAKETAVLAAASMAAETGHALEEKSVLDSAKVMMKAGSRGALMGVVFGGTKGVIPGEEMLKRAARVGVGIALLDAAESATQGKFQYPLDDRPIAQKAFDYGLDVVFLFHGRDPEVVLKGLKDQAKAKGVTVDEAFRLSVAEARAKVNEQQFNRMTEVFKRQFVARGYTEEEATIAAQKAAVRHIEESVGVAGRPPAEPAAPEVTAEARPGTLPAVRGAGFEIPPEAPLKAPAAAAEGEATAKGFQVPPEPAPAREEPISRQVATVAETPIYQGQSRAAVLTATPGEQNMIVAKDAKGNDLGFLWYEKSPGGFLVHRVEVDPVAQRLGVASRLYAEAAEKTGGTYQGSTAQTEEGTALVGALRGRRPEIFPAPAPAEAPRAATATPEAPAPQGPTVPQAETPAQKVARAMARAEAKKVGAVAPAFSQRLYRGEGATPEKVYGAEHVAQGRGYPIMGKASYYAMTRADAETYGDKIAEEEVGLSKPLTLESDQQWRALLRAAGTEELHSTSREQFESPERMPEWTEKLQTYIKSQGYDGVIVKLMPRSEGDLTRRMNETFGHSQVIKFGARPVTAKVTAPERTPILARAVAEGPTGEVVTPAGRKLMIQWAVVEADQIRTSKDPGYPQEYQPRQVGERAAYEAQESAIAGQLDPERLGYNRLSSEGAPLVDWQGNVISGNRRTEALRKIWSGGPAYRERQGRYHEWLLKEARSMGILKEADFNAAAPILVRIITNPTAPLREIAEESNVSAVAAMSASEVAAIDSGNLTPEILTNFQPSETGQINTPQNRDFIRAFMEKVIPAAERNRYMTPEGGLNQEGLARIRNSLFARAYGDNKLVETLTESLDNNIRNITVALQNVAPEVIALEGRIADDYPDLVISKSIADAARKLSALRASGQPDAVKNYLDQPALIADETITPLGKSILALFDAQGKSAKRIQQVISNYLERVDAAVGDPDQVSMLPPTELTADNVWEAATRKAERDAPEQGSLYPTKPGRGRADIAAPVAEAPAPRAPAEAVAPAAEAAVARPPAATPAPVPEAEPRGGEAITRAAQPEAPAGGVKVFDAGKAEEARRRLLARRPPVTEKMATEGVDEDALLDDLVEFGGSLYEQGITEYREWAATIRSNFDDVPGLLDVIEEYLEPAYEGIRARMEASRGEAAARPVPAESRPAAPTRPAEVAGPAGPGAEPAPGGAVGGRVERPGDERTRRIVVARPDVTGPVDTSVVPESLARHLSEDQIIGTAKGIRSLDSVGAFLNADMTGIGKTAQGIAIGKVMADRGHKVVIVSPAQVINLRRLKEGWAFSGSFKDDSERLGVVLTPWVEGTLEPGRVYLTSYHRFHNLPVDENTMMIWDESHRLKNLKSATAKVGVGMVRKAVGNVFYSATPADMAQHVHYLVESGLFGKVSVSDVYKRLGLIQRQQRVPGGGKVMVWEVNPNLQIRQVLERMEKEFSDLTQQGRMLKREIALDGVTVNFNQVPITPAAYAVLNKIEQAYIQEYGELNGLRKAQMLMHQRRALEPFKIEQTVAAVQKSLAANRQAVVFIYRVNYSEAAIKRVIRDRHGNAISEEREVIHASDGTVKTLREALAKAGVTDIAELHGGAAANVGTSMDAFQSGKARVLLATVEKGGTGINLDDRVGNRPRDMVIVTSPFSAVDNIQAIGRLWRRTTKSYITVNYLYAPHDIDNWNMGITAYKMKLLGAVVGGDIPKLDVSEQGLTEADFTGRGGAEELETMEPEREGMAVGAPAQAPTPPPVAPEAPRGTFARLFGRQQQVRKDQMIQEMAKALRMAQAGALALKGHVVGRGVRGWRHRISGNIRARQGTDIDTFAHEFGHALQRDGLNVTNAELMPFKMEMKALVQVMGVKGPYLSEGFAEFARLYATDPATARAVAPTFAPWFEARLSTQPDLERAFNQFRDRILQLRASTPEERIGRMVAPAAKATGIVRRATEALTPGNLRNQVAEHVFWYLNRWLPFEQMVKIADPTDTKLPAAKDPYKLVRTLNARTVAHADFFLSKGVVDWNTGHPVPGTKGLDQIEAPIIDRREDYTRYVMARVMQSRAMSGVPRYESQAEHLRKLGDLTETEVGGVIARYENQHPDFRTVFGEFQEFNDGYLQYLADSGSYSDKAIDTIRDMMELYLPLNRLMDNPADPISAGSPFAGSVARPLKRIRGTSERIVLDPLVEYRRNLFLGVGSALRNNVLAETMDLLESPLAVGKFLGTFMEKVNTPSTATTFQLREIRATLEAALQEAGLPLSILDSIDLGTMATVFQPNRHNLPNNEIVVWRQGKPVVAQVLNRMLLGAVSQLTRGQVKGLMEHSAWAGVAIDKIMRGPARMLRRGIVFSPDFMPAHMSREQQEAMASGYGPLPPFMQGLTANSETLQRFLAGGGRIFSYKNLDRATLSKHIDDIKEGAWYEGNIRRTAKELGEKLVRLWDETTRVGVAKIEQAAPRPIDVQYGQRSVDIEAGFRGREAGVDFDLKGASEWFQRYMQMVTFMNPALQGFYRNVRMFKDAWQKPNSRVRHGLLLLMGMSLFTEIASYLLNKDDPRYKAETEESKNMYFHLIPPGAQISQGEWDSMQADQRVAAGKWHWKFPKAYLLGWIAATAPRQVLEWADGNDPALFSRLARSFWQVARFEGIPTTIRVAAEVAFNKDLWRWRPINAPWESKMPPELQGRGRGPVSAQQISAVLQQTPALKNLHLTPADVEHIARGWAGYYGGYSFSLIDRLEGMATGKGAAPAIHWTDFPGLQRFFGKMPPSYTRAQEDFSDFYTKTQGAMQGLTASPPERRAGFRQEHEFEIRESGLMAAHASFLTNARKTIDRIRKEPTMSPEAKRDATDRQLLSIMDQTQKVMDRVRSDREVYEKSKAVGVR